MRQCIRLAAIALIWLALATPTEADTPTLPFQPLPGAMAQAAATDRVTLVVFSARWCGWCQKMEATTFTDPRVLQWADRFTFAMVDVDEEPAIASAFGVQALPALALVNARGELLDQVNGYYAPQALSDLLEAHVDQSQSPGRKHQQMLRLLALSQQLSTASAEQLPRIVDGLLEVLAQPDRAGRAQARQRLAAEPAAAPHLVAALRSEALARRAAAHDVLVEVTGATLPYDAFADPATRQQQAAAWEALIATQFSPSDADAAPPAPAEPAQ